MNRIVALHGNVGGPSDWLPLEREIGISFDKRCLWEPRALEFSQDDILLGYSLGGRLALQAAVANPTKFRAVVVISAHPGLATISERQDRLNSDTVWANAAATLPWSEFLKQWDAQSVLGESSADRAGLEKHRLAIAEAFREWSLGGQPDLRDSLRNISCPLHWITGERDTKFTQLAASAGTGIHHVVANAGHRVHLEQPAEVTRVLRLLL